MVVSGHRNLNFLVVGAARSGTTWLYHCLREHPELFLPERKELHFFDNDRLYNKGMDYYWEFFKGNDKGLKQGEVTPRYIVYEDALWRIKKHFPEASIIVLLRDPVERAFSQYCYFRFNKKKEPSTSLKAALEADYWEDYIYKSLYFRQMESVFRIFGRDNVLIAYYEDIGERPRELLREMYGFLGVDPNFSPEAAERRINGARLGVRPPPTWVSLLNKELLSLKRPVGGETHTNTLAPDHLPARFKDSPAIRKGLRRSVDVANWLFDRFPVTAKETPALSESEKADIYGKYFRDDVEQLERLLGVHLTRWKHEGQDGSRTVSADFLKTSPSQGAWKQRP